MKFGDKIINCPKCGSDNVEKTDFNVNAGTYIILIIVFIFMASMTYSTFVFYVLVGAIIGIFILLYNIHQKEKENIWEIKCNNCNNIFSITDPTLNNNFEKIKSLCPHCGAEIIEGSKFCSSCGNEINNGKKCPNCGSNIKDDEKFCHSCGNKVN